MIESARIVITRYLDDDGEDLVKVEATLADGEPGLPLIESLGMIEIAKDSIWRDAMAADDDDG